MRRPKLGSLLEAWARAREIYSDDIAQEGYVRTLGRKRRDVDEISYMMTECRYLHVVGYTDGADIKKIRGTNTKAYGLPINERREDPTCQSHESRVIALEEASRLDQAGVQFTIEGYESRRTGRGLNVCPKGHEGRTYFHKGANGYVFRRCKQCALESTWKYRRKKREQGGQASEGL